MSIQQALASIGRKIDRHLPEERAVRILRRSDIFSRVFLPICMIVFACVELLKKLVHPQVATAVPVTPAGGALQGKVTSVTVELTDPNLLDRLVATAPSLVNFTLVVAAFGYLLWAGKIKKVEEVKAPRGIKWILCVVGVMGTALLLGPILTALLVSQYFGVRVSLYGVDTGALLLVSAVLLLLVSAAEGSLGWVAERQRAENLDGQMKDVV
jgi:hypothetical protein